MNRILTLGILVLSLILVTTACGSANSPLNSNENHTPSGNDSITGDGSLPESPGEGTFLLEAIDVTPSILAAGEDLQIFIQQSISGEVNISTSSEKVLTQPFSGSSDTIKLPETLTDGVYLVELVSGASVVAVSTFRVSAQPGVWISTDRVFIDEGSAAVLRIQNYQVPEEAVGAIYLTDPTGKTTPFVMDENGNLIPGLPVPLSEFLDQELVLANAAGSIQFRAVPATEGIGGDQEPTEGWESNLLTLSACDQPGSVTGELPASGYVNAIWLNGEIFSRSMYTEDGRFDLAVGPGSVIVQTLVEGSDGYEFNQQSIDRVCGENIQLGADLQILNRQAASIDDFKTASVDFLGWRAAKVSSLSSQNDRDQICRRGLIDASVSIEGAQNPELSMAAGFALKSAVSQTSPRISLVTYADLRALLEEAARNAADSDGEVDLDAVNTALNTDFLIRLTASTLGESLPVLINSIPSQDGDRALFVSDKSSTELLGSVSNPVYQGFAGQFVSSAICGEVEPEHKTITLGKEVPLEYRVSDLSGAPADGAGVTISEPECGTLKPENGPVDGGVFMTTYQSPEDQFCSEELAFSAEWNGPLGGLKTKHGEAIAEIAPQKPYLELSVGYVPGIGDQNANIVEVATFYEDWMEARAPGGLNPVSQAGECGYLEGGQSLFDEYWYQTVNSTGKRAESAFSILPFSNLTDRATGYSDTEVDHFMFRTQTYAYAVPVEDDTPAREASAYAGNGSIISMGIPSTVFVIDIYNPGELPVTPMMQWNASYSNDDADFGGLLFYKVISCGANAGLDSYASFMGSNIQELYYFDAESGGDPSGLIPLPETTDERTQVLVYIMNYSVATSIRDDADGLYHAGLNKLTTEIDIYLSQQTGGE